MYINIYVCVSLSVYVCVCVCAIPARDILIYLSNISKI